MNCTDRLRPSNKTCNPQYPTPSTKHSCLSTADPMVAGRCLVEAPSFLPDGYILNWSTATCPSDLQSQYYGAFQSRHSTHHHSADAPGSKRNNPIFVVDSDEASATKFPTSSTSDNQSSWSILPSTAVIPPRFRGKFSTATLSDASGDEIDSDVSYKLKSDFPGDLNVELHDTIIILKNLPLDVTFQDIVRLLAKNSFHSSLVHEITFFSGRTAAIQFTRHDLADAAYVVLDRINDPFPWKGHHDMLLVERCPRERNFAADLAVNDNFLNNTGQPQVVAGSVDPRPERDLSLLYGSLRRDVYEDEDSGSEVANCRESQATSQVYERDTAGIRMSNDTAIRPPDEPHPISDSLSDSESTYSYSDSDSYSDTSSDVDPNIDKHLGALTHATTFDGGSYSPIQASSLRRAHAGDLAIGSSELLTGNGHQLHALAHRKSQAPLLRSDTTRPTASSAINNPLRKVPTAPYNRARRLLVPASSGLPITTISMRSDAQFFDPHKHHRISKYSLPFGGDYCHVKDACIVGDTVVVGYGDGPHQISLIPIMKGKLPLFVDLNHRPHIRRNMPSHMIAKGGVHISCLAPVQSDSPRSVTKFISGGYDKSLRLWTVTGENSENVTSERVTAQKTIPYALACRGQRVISSAGKSLLTMEMERPSSEPKSAILSNIIHQIHIHPQAPNVTVLEVNHLDHQIQLFDDRRRHGFDRRPDSFFGYRHKGRADSRYSRGSTHFSHFVRGYPDGSIRIWDYRNTKYPITKAQHQRLDAVVHTVFTSTQIIAYGQETVTFLDHNGNTL